MSITVRRFQRATQAGAGAASYSLWTALDAPGTVSDLDANSLEVGVAFSSSIPAYIKGIRFYKAANNTGTHTGSLWSTAGTRLATGTFSAETASGWQSMLFATPYAVAANTTYIASYFVPNGHYSSDANYFSAAHSASFLTAPATTTAPNGVFHYGGASSFPSESYNATNYWVDVIAAPLNDTVAPTAPSALSAVVTGGSVALSWAASTDAIGVAGYRVYRDAAYLGSSASLSYTDPTGSALTTYTYTVQAYDFSGNLSPTSTGLLVTTGANTPPVASFSVSPSGLSVYVNAGTSSDSDGTISVYSWAFGDTSTTTGRTANHVYGADGTYTITLTVTDNNGATHTTSHDVTVSASGFMANLINNPSAGGYPDASNTGVPTGTSLTAAGYLSVTTPGAIVENLDITGNIVVRANNVTIRNCRITSGDSYPIENMATNLLIEDCDIIGVGSGVACSVAFNGYTIRRCDISGGADGLKADWTCTVEDCYIHDLYVTSESHNDGIQTTGGDGVNVVHNTFAIGSAGVAIQFGSSNDGWIINNNLIHASGWALNGSPSTTNATVINNRFVRTPGWYGPSSIAGTGTLWSGNYYDDTGEEI